VFWNSGARTSRSTLQPKAPHNTNMIINIDVIFTRAWVLFFSFLGGRTLLRSVCSRSSTHSLRYRVRSLAQVKHHHTHCSPGSPVGQQAASAPPPAVPPCRPTLSFDLVLWSVCSRASTQPALPCQDLDIGQIPHCLKFVAWSRPAASSIKPSRVKGQGPPQPHQPSCARSMCGVIGRGTKGGREGGRGER
jgi:hypothetical protein